ncbi:MAG: bifunctional 4-hydroxy-2-oxoglutarate aldolase/2-dehydro-3-deoxy-phosphogluconate aldolase [Pseudomonadota bacterium]|jgi:2-dehydro-3-deoxyphosphogluconate aldolase/(4S)-4-hydroxy-2-oxoglutarate aldolase
MSRQPALDIVKVMGLSPVIPVITIHDANHAAPLAEALYAGGLRVLEVTLRTPAGLESIERMRRAVPDAVVGVGTLATAAQFASADAAGAQFGVSPGLTPALMDAAKTVEWPLLPGVMTPSELIAARTAGFKACKLFPAQQAGGIGMLKALHAVFPDIVFCPTGGITRQTAPDFLALPNVRCVGGSWLIPDDALRAGDWARIEGLARDAASLR